MPAGTQYTVQLYFAEPENLKAGQRVFDVRLNGQTVAQRLDPAAHADGNNGLVREFQTEAQGRLTIELVAVKGEPVLSGVEIIPQRP